MLRLNIEPAPGHRLGHCGRAWWDSLAKLQDGTRRPHSQQSRFTF